ncbi:MAG TPA: hypothetical protein PKU80_03790 [Candidatus Limiplasma sp.]|nr:hypothetical protein [Candidatus Limiplasma sp.]HRX09136.1 hypothetical protein [Candidatus Limiplasma sp.]
MRRFIGLLLIVFLCCATALSGVDDLVIDPSAVSLDLNSLEKLTQGGMNQLADKLNAAPSVTSCDLSAVQMSLATMAELAEQCPQVAFHFTIPVADLSVDGLSETLDLDGLKRATKVKYNELKQIISCMPNLTHVVMYNATFSLELMEKLLALYPELTFAWTLRFNEIEVKNTATAFSTLKGRQDPRYTAKQLEPLTKYCPDLLALDVGHNNVHDLSFLSAWPNLRWLIVIDSKVPLTDISPLKDLMDLEYIELFMQNITDISPLANHEKLLDLNLSHNDITDLSPLYSCVNLERLYISVNPNLTQEEIDKLQAVLPDLRIEHSEWQSTGAGWREHQRYFTLYEGFSTGVYIPFE